MAQRAVAMNLVAILPPVAETTDISLHFEIVEDPLYRALGHPDRRGNLLAVARLCAAIQRSTCA
jgi:hypothetical protein